MQYRPDQATKAMIVRVQRPPFYDLCDFSRALVSLKVLLQR